MITIQQIEKAIADAKAKSGMYAPHSVRVMTQAVHGQHDWTNLYDVTGTRSLSVHQIELLIFATKHNSDIARTGEIAIHVSLQQGGQHFCTK